MLSIVCFVLFTIFVGVVTWFITRKDDHDSSTGMYLAGRSLTWPLIGMSLLLVNLSTEQMVGLNGAAFRDGFCVMVWEVIAVMALVAMALFFLPKFLRSGIATVPQYLSVRFDSGTQTITNIIFLIAYAVVLLPIIVYTGATGMITILDLQTLLGIDNRMTALWLIIAVISIIGVIYTLWGGLRAIAVSNLLNGIGLLIGGLLITYFSFDMLSDGNGLSAGIAKLGELIPEKTNSIGGNESSVPFHTIFTGIMILNLFYWCTNQQIIQQTFGASSLAEGQKGVLFTGALKLIGPLYLVIPGMIAYAMFASPGAPHPIADMKADDAYGTLVQTVLPGYLTGFFAAVCLGAILSSFNGALNSICTLFGLGVYKNFNPAAPDDQVVKKGRVCGLVVTVVVFVFAPFLYKTESIFSYLQDMNAIYFVPVFSVVLVGMLTKRVPSIAAKIGLLFSLFAIIAGYFIPPFNGILEESGLHNFHFIALVLAFTIVLMLVIGLVKPRATDFVQEDVKAVNMTRWKLTYPVGIVLVICVILIYAFFADFTVLDVVSAAVPE
jgi:SSS family solute:Na+ symporter